MDQKNNIELFAANKLREHLEIAELFNEKLLNMQKEAQGLQASILTKKRVAPGLTYMDVKDQLTKFQVLNYECFVLEQDLGRNSIVVIDYMTMTDLFKIPVNLTDTQKAIMERIRSNSGQVFGVDENKQVIVANKGVYNDVMGQTIEKAKTPEALQYMFNSPLFSEAPNVMKS